MDDLFDTLYDHGFIRIAVLDGKACGINQKRLILGFIPYKASAESDHLRDAVIHPYYPLSQRAYHVIRAYVQKCTENGIDMRIDSSVHIKNILSRLSFLERGKNTLSYLSGYGSRFHVQILTSDDSGIAVTDELEPEPHETMCGQCRRCIEACPGGAIQPDGFIREKCLRYWMLNGKVPPEKIARAMGNRFIGCDICEACCPHNNKGGGIPITVPLMSLLTEPGSANLSELIGKNYAIANRVTAQACTIAGSLKRTDLAEKLETVRDLHHSPLCRQTAAMALQLMKDS